MAKHSLHLFTRASEIRKSPYDPEQYHPEYPLVIADGSSHVEAVARALCTFGREARMSIDETNALGGCRGDFGKKVGCIGVKWLWFVEAHTPGRQVIRTNN